MQDLGGQDELPIPHGDDLRSRSPFTDVDALALYLSLISRYALLSAADEIAIGYAIRDSRDKLDLRRLQRRASVRRLATIQNELTQARNRLITSNLRLVVSIAKKY